MKDARKLAKALSQISVSEVQFFMASVLLKFRGIQVALEFVENQRRRNDRARIERSDSREVS